MLSQNLVQGWVKTWSKYVAQQNWTKCWLKKWFFLVFFACFSFKSHSLCRNKNIFEKQKMKKERENLDQVLTQERLFLDQVLTLQHIYIYIYAVVLLSGPSLAFWGVIIWAKFVFYKTLFVKNTIKIGVSALFFLKKKLRAQIWGVIIWAKLVIFKMQSTWPK